jgi:hypothetical protein
MLLQDRQEKAAARLWRVLRKQMDLSPSVFRQ